MTIEIVDWRQSWGPVVELAANTGIQFLDFEFSKDTVKRFVAAFVEDRLDDEKRILKELRRQEHPFSTFKKYFFIYFLILIKSFRISYATNSHY